MASVKEFNGLNGSEVSRADLKQLLILAKKEDQQEIVSRIETLLEENPDDSFLIDIKEFAIEVIPAALLGCFECLEEQDQVYGLGKAVSADDIYSLVTNLMLNTIKEVGHLPWQKGWVGAGLDGAMNYVSKKQYSGINFLLLNFDIKRDADGRPYLVPVDFNQPYYLTFNQIEKGGAKLKKESKGREVIYYSMLLIYDDKNVKFSGTDAEKFKVFANKHKISSAQIQMYLKRLPILKYYKVFKADDCEGLKFSEIKKKIVEPIEAAQEIIDNFPNKPVYRYGTDRAYYMPATDTISMPNIIAFRKEAEYYSTFFHEMVHSTGHKSRLDREMSMEDEKYAFEELIAELGAVFLCAKSGILFSTRENSAKYLHGWNKRLVGVLESDNRFFMKAAAAAQKASDLITSGTKIAEVIEPKKEKPQPTIKPRKKPKSKKKSDPDQLALLAPVIKSEDKNSLGRIITESELKTFADTVKTTPVIETVNEVIPTVAVENSKEITNLKKLGFVSAAEVPEEPKDVFVLPGAIGEFIQKIQPHKALIIIKGTKHTSKSQLAMQVANAFGEMGKPVAYIDYEQGGMESKDTVDSINRNTTPKGRALIMIKGHLENPFEELKSFCQHCKVIVADSVTDLGITADQLNTLRCDYVDVIWVFISQVKENGEMYGGNKMAHNPTCIIECHPSHEPKERYATLNKNRGNDLNLEYWIMDKKLKIDETKVKDNKKFKFNAIEI